MIRKAVELARGLFGVRKDHPSVVLLLRTPRDFSQEAVLNLAMQCWSSPEDHPKIAGSPRPGSYLIQVSSFFFALHCAAQRYELRLPLQEEIMQRAWQEHTAWIAIDYPRGDRMPRDQWPSCYNLLMLMVNKLWDDHCTGIYFPAEGVTVPNTGDLVPSIRWAAQHGAQLQFLKRK